VVTRLTRLSTGFGLLKLHRSHNNGCRRGEDPAGPATWLNQNCNRRVEQGGNRSATESLIRTCFHFCCCALPSRMLGHLHRTGPRMGTSSQPRFDACGTGLQHARGNHFIKAAADLGGATIHRWSRRALDPAAQTPAKIEVERGGNQLPRRSYIQELLLGCTPG
jgi:hypothetical protein